MTRRNVVVYLSGKLSDPNPKLQARNISCARVMSAILWNLGFTVICPHTNAPQAIVGCKCSYDDYLEGDIQLMLRCDCVFMMSGWMSSKGSVIEHQAAADKRLPIFYDTKALLKHADDVIGGKDDPYN